MNTIILHNFRCFGEQSVSFKSGINLLIGDNASGKTSLLKGCRYALSAFFSGFSDENTLWVGFEKSDFQEIIVDGISLPERPVRIDFEMNDVFGENDEFPRFKEKYYLLKKKSHGSRTLKEGIKRYSAFASYLQTHLFDYQVKAQVMPLPLFAFFSTEDIHSKRKLNREKFKSYTPKNSLGYYGCLDGYGLLEYWHARLLVLKEANHNMEEIEVVRQALIAALGHDGCNILRDIDIRPNRKAVYYLLVDGREVEAGQLPDGFRRIISIVMDLAFRCVLLNKAVFGREVCRYTKGTVLIDEVDMHLHPSLQSVLLGSLQRTFPKLQFIVSSHAPMVMSGVESNESNVVYMIGFSEESGYTISEINTYGMDMSTISQVVLKVTPRVKNVAIELERLFALIDNGEYEDAKKLLVELQQRYSDTLPELVKAETMLDFMI